MKSDAERMSDLRRRRMAQGLKQITLWVPADAAGEVRDLVRRHLEKRRRQTATVAATSPARLELVFRFPEKPDFETREGLKAEGFTYHPDQNMWTGTLPRGEADDWEERLAGMGAEILAKQRRPGD